MKDTARGALGRALTPAARAWVRHAPLPLGKKWLWDRFYWRHRTFSCRTRFGARITGSTEDLIQRYIYYFGVWEPHISRWVSSTLRPGDGFIDVGANIGYYSLLAARVVGRSGRVVAIEAAPSIHQILQRHVALNQLGNIRTVLAAATERAETMQVVGGGASNIGSTRTLARTAKSEGGTCVTGLPLSEILRDDEIERARIIKIDVEGAEVSVVRGLIPILGRLREDAEILVEISPALMAEGHSAGEIFSTFREHGFTAYALRNDYSPESYFERDATRTPVPWNEATTDFEQADVLFSRARR